MTRHAVFKAALVRICFNSLTANEIVDNGFDEISVLGEVEDKDIDELIRHIGRWRRPQLPMRDATCVLVDPAPQQITLPFLSINNLKAMRCWVLKKMYQDVSFTSVECMNAEVRVMLTRMTFLKAQSSSSSDNTAKPTALKTFASW